MSFSEIPIRQNGLDQLIEASWFNTIRTKLVEVFGSGGYIFVQALQPLIAAATITVDADAIKAFIPVVGSGGAVTINSLPFTNLHGFSSGKEIILMGTDDVNTVKILSNDSDEGFILNGSSVTLKKWNKLTVMYYAQDKRFIELSRNF